MFWGCGVQENARVVCRESGQDDHRGFLHLALFLVIVVFDSGHVVAARIREYAGDAAKAANASTGFIALSYC
jgi:hypothetical protein